MRPTHSGESKRWNHRQLIGALRRRDADEVVRLTDWQFTDGAKRLTERLEETGIWS